MQDWRVVLDMTVEARRDANRRMVRYHALSPENDAQKYSAAEELHNRAARIAARTRMTS